MRRNENIFNDDSFDGPKPVLRQPRKPASLRLPQSEKDSRKETEADQLDSLFDKLTITDKKENVDPFDQLFNNLPNKTEKKSEIRAKNQNFSDVSLPEEDDSSEDVLFSSFSKTNLKAKSGPPRVFKPKTKSHRAKSVRSARTKSEASVKVPVHDETLDVKMIFSESVQSPLPAGSSLTDLSPSSVNFGRSMSKLATSTPMLVKSKPQLFSGNTYHAIIKSSKTNFI